MQTLRHVKRPAPATAPGEAQAQAALQARFDARTRARAQQGGPAPHAAPLQAALDQSAGVRAQGALRSALDHSARVTAVVERTRTLGERSAARHAAPASAAVHGGVVQGALTPGARKALRGGLVLGGLGAGAYYGSAFGPLGTLGGGVLGGALGYYAPSALRWLRSGKLWDEVNRDERDYRTWNTPQNLADQLARSSPQFRALRALADKEVRRTHGRALAYSGDAQKTGGHSAVYGGGTVYVDEESYHPATTAQNLVFETANAAQTRFFDTLRADYADGSLADKSLAHYGELLGRKPGELGTLAEEYAHATLEARRSLLQEWAEWNSLELSRAAFQDIAPHFESDTAQDQWAVGFGPRLAARNFTEYYTDFGEDHRQQVQHALERAKLKQD